MTRSLHVLEGCSALRRFPITTDRMVIGSGADADIRLMDEGISHEHAEITLDNQQIRVRDLGSRNGTFLEGKRIDGIVIFETGQVLSLGSAALCLAEPSLRGTRRLLGLTGRLRGKDLPLSQQVVRLGRGKSLEIPLDDSAASRHHAEIRQEGGLSLLADCGSVNGSKLNGDLIRGIAPLRSGDRIQIGASIFAFLDGALEDLAGTSILGVRLLELIGQGSAGVIYQGIRETDSQTVAVKVFDPSVFRSHEDREGLHKALEATQHAKPSQHLMPIQMVRPWTQDHPAAAILPWATNGSLMALMQRHDGETKLIPPQIIASILCDAARGLSEAERQGIFHAGLRPGDILIDASGMGVISDLLLVDPKGHESSAGGLYPYYLSPEEVEGARPDALSNQFSLGCIAYQALTGTVPFAANRPELVRRARLTARLPAIRQFNQEVPEPLVKAVDRLLNRNRSDRYPAWDEFTSAMERILALGDSAVGPSARHSIVDSSPRVSVPQRASGRMRGRGIKTDSNMMAAQSPQSLRSLAPLAILAIALVLVLFVLWMLR